MAFGDLARQAVDTCFATLGQSATYTPPVGSPVGCMVMEDTGDQTISGPSGAKAFAEGGIFEIRKSEVAEPVSGGIIALLDDAGAVISWHKISGDPRSEDRLRYVWRCMARPFTP